MSIPKMTRRRNLSGEKQVAASRKFSVGQIVRFRPDTRDPFIPDEDYRIVAALPSRDSCPQYRVRNMEEPYERVVTEDKIMQVKEVGTDSRKTLIEKTFGSKN
jgi:hypothetical protein